MKKRYDLRFELEQMYDKGYLTARKIYFQIGFLFGMIFIVLFSFLIDWLFN